MEWISERHIMLHGIINVYKEAGFTSHDVVAKLRGIFRQKKIGHTGTLDPAAVGVLPVCLGKATKVCDLLTDKDKTYRCIMLLGIDTDTQDTTGEILSRREVTVTKQEVTEVVMSFVGEYQQIPPMYSALKVNGKKLYELARAGQEVERKARPVRIEEIVIESMELPRVTFQVTCSKGTYIRTLCHDIGQKLSCGGCMEHLTRTRVADFTLEDSMTLGEIEAAVKGIDFNESETGEYYGNEARRNSSFQNLLRPVDDLFRQYPKATVKESAGKLLENGNRIPVTELSLWQEEWETVPLRLYDGKGRFAGIYRYQPEAEDMKPIKIFLEKD